MQVSVETSAGLERRMRVQVPADKIESEVAARLQKVGRSAKIKGFRPGKIPAKVIKQHYGGQVRQEVLHAVEPCALLVIRLDDRPGAGSCIGVEKHGFLGARVLGP